MIPSRVSLRMIEEDGEPRARLMFSDLAFTVDPAAVSFIDGELRVRIPAWIDVPTEATVVERWLQPTPEQVRLAVEALDASTIETLMLRQQEASADQPFGAIARQAVALACAPREPGDA